MEETKFLSLSHLEKVYPGGEKAVYDFNLEIERGEFIVVVGPSGCGKSTTLRMVAGLEDVTSGEINLEGELLNYKPCKDRKMAIVFQSYALYPQMNVYDNIAFPLTINTYPYPVVREKLFACTEILRLLSSHAPEKILEAVKSSGEEKGKRSKEETLAERLGISIAAAKLLYADTEGTPEEWAERTSARIAELSAQEKAELDKDGISVNEACEELDAEGNVVIRERKMTSYEIKQKVYETADILDLVPYLDKLPKQLSGGQMQRVALGRAIVKNVPIFLMDEPLSNLDAKLRLTMRSEIVKLHNRIHATTIYVTHDQTEAMTMASRIVVMSKGFIQQIGTPEEVYSHPANIFIARFIGAPTMNIFEFEYDRENNVLTYGQMCIDAGAFRGVHEKFYAGKREIFETLLLDFGKEQREYILKVLSATGESDDGRKEAVKKKGLIARIKRLFSKKKTEEDPFKRERGIAQEKLERILTFEKETHKILVGVRPERMHIEKYDPARHKDCLVVKPDVCELLGAEYNVHFNFYGRNAIGQVDAQEKISIRDDIAVWFSADDIYIFDPITGDKIV